MNYCRLLAIYCFMLVQSVCFAQRKEHLYYSINKKDSLVGVKDHNDKIIIPPDYLNLRYDDREKIADNVSLIVMERFSGIKGKPAESAGDAFDRNGKLLFHPLRYDNGPDYESEGTIRCVENGKVGFVNREGKIIIEPQWDWAAAFNYGYAIVCNGCYFDFTKDAEHPEMAFYPKHETYYIDKTGLKINALLFPTDSAGDYPVTDSSFLPYPFKYNAFEQSIVDSFNKLKVLKNIVSSNSGCTVQNHLVRFELTERPTLTFPFYVIKGFERRNKSIIFSNDNTFLIDTKGNWFYYDILSGKKTKFNKWFKENSNRK